VSFAALFGLILPTAAQTFAPTVARIDAGSLNHGDLFRVQLTLGATLGWRVSPGTTVSLRYLRQSQTAEGTDLGNNARTFVQANWELALGAPATYKRQALIRFGLGAMFRPVLSTAAVGSAAFMMRYGLAHHWSLLASIEDDAALLPTDDAIACDRSGFCASHHFAGHLEHNLGFLISGEWRR
jgi:hypothetical protein